jgi:hypothetical protein
MGQLLAACISIVKNGDNSSEDVAIDLTSSAVSRLIAGEA